MKKYLGLLFLLCLTTLDAVELKRDGWNLVGVCQDINRSDISMNNIEEIQSQEGKSIYTGAYASYTNLQQLEAGYGYWVKSTKGNNFNVGERNTALIRPLKRKGWNLMALCENLSANDFNMNELSEVQNQDGQSIYTGNNSNASNLTNFEAGYGYWINGDKNHNFTAFHDSTKTTILTFYISPIGSDDNNGSASHPWRSIQASIDKINTPATLILKAGVYSEKVRFVGEEDSNINLKGESNAIIDGTGLTPIGREGLIGIEEAHGISIENIELRNFKTAPALENVNTPVGILIHAGAYDINISNNNIHHIENLSTCGESSDCGTGANGIAVYGDTVKTMTNLNFKENEVHHCILSASEAFTINGNIDGFTVIGNYVHDNNNIGIDIIGYEEDVCTACSQENNRARNGMVKNNRSINNSTNLALGSFSNNPWYEGKDGSAGGFYVDGGHHIIFDGNYASQNDLGFEFASEHAGKATHDILMINNYIYNNREVGLTLGGYAQSPTAQGGGEAQNIMVYNNSFYKNAGWGSEIAFSYRVKDTSIVNNIFYGEEAVADNFSTETNSQTENITWGKNLWWASDVSDTTGIQGEFILANPLYVNASIGNLDLQASSPAINQGFKQADISNWGGSFWEKAFKDAFIPAHGTEDIHGGNRFKEQLDMGGNEFSF